MYNVKFIVETMRFAHPNSELQSVVFNVRSEDPEETIIIKAIEEIIFHKTASNCIKPMRELRAYVQGGYLQSAVHRLIRLYMDNNDYEVNDSQLIYSATEFACALLFALLYDDEKGQYNLGNNVYIMPKCSQVAKFVSNHKNQSKLRKHNGGLPKSVIGRPLTDMEVFAYQMRNFQLYRISKYAHLFADKKALSMMLDFFSEEFFEGMPDGAFANLQDRTQEGFEDLFQLVKDQTHSSPKFLDGRVHTADRIYMKQYFALLGDESPIDDSDMPMHIKLYERHDQSGIKLLFTFTHQLANGVVVLDLSNQRIDGYDIYYDDSIIPNIRYVRQRHINLIASYYCYVALREYFDICNSTVELHEHNTFTNVCSGDGVKETVFVAPFLKRLPVGWVMSDEAKEHAKRFHFSVPEGYTFVTPFTKSVRKKASE